MSNGVLFFLAAAGRRGKLHAIHLRVAVMTLRRNSFAGNIQIMAGDDEAVKVCREIASDKRLSCGPGCLVAWSKADFDPTKEKCYAAKTRANEWSPFDQTIYADCDMVFLGSIYELWPLGNEIVFTKFANWTSLGGKIVHSRIESWKPFAPKDVAAALAIDMPAVNTGIFGFHRNATFFKPWQELCDKDPKHWIGDESAAQVLIASRSDHRLIDGKYNACPLYGPIDDIRVAHFHGCKAFRRDSAGDLYRPHLKLAYDLDYGGCRAAVDQCDEARKLLGI